MKNTNTKLTNSLFWAFMVALALLGAGCGDKTEMEAMNATQARLQEDVQKLQRETSTNSHRAALNEIREQLGKIAGSVTQVGDNFTTKLTGIENKIERGHNTLLELHTNAVNELKAEIGDVRKEQSSAADRMDKLEREVEALKTKTNPPAITITTSSTGTTATASATVAGISQSQSASNSPPASVPAPTQSVSNGGQVASIQVSPGSAAIYQPVTVNIDGKSVKEAFGAMFSPTNAPGWPTNALMQGTGTFPVSQLPGAQTQPSTQGSPSAATAPTQRRKLTVAEIDEIEAATDRVAHEYSNARSGGWHFHGGGFSLPQFSRCNRCP